MNTKSYNLETFAAQELPLATTPNLLGRQYATPLEEASTPTLVDAGVVENSASVRLRESLPQSAHAPLSPALLPAEADFYGQYTHCINAFPTMRETVKHLSGELGKLDGIVDGWQKTEVITNIYLLACAITDSIDDYLAGSTYDFSKIARAVPVAAPGVRAVNKLFKSGSRLRAAWLRRVRRWRNEWAAAVTDFLRDSLAVANPQHTAVLEHCRRLAALLPPAFPAALWNRRHKIPAFFRSRDFAPQDATELGRKFTLQFPADGRPVTLMGLRTAGSFLAALLCAQFRSQRRESDWITVRPRTSVAPWEQASLRRAAGNNARAVIVDESIHSGQTLTRAVDLLRRAGFRDEDIVVLNPVEPAIPQWKSSLSFQALSGISFITLEPTDRYKQRFLDSPEVEGLLNEYFQARGYRRAQIVNTPETNELNDGYRGTPERVDIRLKRVYAVCLENAGGDTEIRYVLAKSVGWGWLGYHAFLAGRELSEFVAPILGLREGILYSEWFPQQQEKTIQSWNRAALIECLAAYVARRAKHVRLQSDPRADLARDRRHKGAEILANVLARAYGSRVVATLKRLQLQQRLAALNGPAPTLCDGKMEPQEWIVAGSRLLKTDFEHHGQGKNELAMNDAAFDLASAIFHFGLTEAETAELTAAYVEKTADKDFEQRLFLNKLLVGVWAQNVATLGLQSPRLLERRQEFNRQFISSWNFLIAAAVRECGRQCGQPREVEWKSPLVVADIDGVLDRMVFGFPSTTAAGIKAISTLHAHGVAIAVNTARTLQEVKQYCRAYGFVGGVAEYGAVAWDGVADRELVLVSPESLHEMKVVKKALCQIPGIFLNDDYQYSLRAFTYQNGRTAPLPALLVQDLLAGLNVERLQVHHTGLDTAIVAKETDKGAGLVALLRLAGISPEDAIAVGDSEPDLAMFRAAGRAFAPGNVTCAREAGLLRCHIARAMWQPGLLEIARTIVHPDGDTCERCRAATAKWQQNSGDLIVGLLKAADERPLSQLLRNCWSRTAFDIFKI